jgi:hypothetical protein
MLREDPLDEILGANELAATLEAALPEPTSLQVAAAGGDQAEVQRLLRGGADPNQIHEELAATPLHLGARQGDLRMIDDLLDAGADIEAWSLDAETPAMTAARYREHAAVRRLLARGAVRPRGMYPFIAVDNSGDGDGERSG